MNQSAVDSPPLGEISRRIAQRALTWGGNRIELFMVEVQEERKHLLHILFLGVLAATLGLLAFLALSGAVVLYFWNFSPLAVLLGLTLVYALGAVILYHRVLSIQNQWKAFTASLDQLEKDRLWLEKCLA